MNIPLLASRIDSVTVYREGALVTRAASLPGGEPVPPLIKIGNLPLSLSDDSVRVRVEAPAGSEAGADVPVAGNVRVSLDLAVVDESLPPPDDEALEAARQQVLALSERILHLGDRRRRLERLQLVDRPAGKRGALPLPSPVEARLALLAFRHETLAALDQELLEAHAEARRAADVKEDLEQRRRAASQARQARSHELRKVAVVSLRGQAVPAAPLRVVVEYMVPGARWAPSYAVKLSPDLRRATLAVRAVVAQHTGEDWSGVELALATAEAMGWTELPELQALRIGRRQRPPLRRGWRAAPVGASELYGDYDRFVAANPGAAAPPPPARPRPPTRPGPAVMPAAPPQPVMASPVADFREESTPVWSDDEAASMMRSMDALEEEVMRAPAKKRSRAKEKASAPPRGGAVPPPAAPMMASRAFAAPPPAQAMAYGAGGAAPGGGPPPEAFEAFEDPAAPEATSEQLAYGDLRMPAPGDGRRGRLVLARRRERYLELLRIHEVEFDVIDVVDQAVRRAGQVGARALPPRHRPVAGWSGYNFVYRGDGSVDIPSDGNFHGIPLRSEEADVAVEHVVVPRESTDVFRRIVLHNPLQAPLLAGPADIYMGGDYLMTTDVQLAPPRGKVEIGLGVDQSIKVSRNTRFAEESTGLMGGSLTLRHEIAIEVANHRDRPVRVEVQERIPITRENEDEIQVSVGPVEPAWASFEPEGYHLQGGYRWQIDVPAGKKQALRAAYAIKISAKKELAGGNRREA